MINKITSNTNLYHGTSKESKKSIIASKEFYLSQSDKEWAGTGIYFFIDQDDDSAKKNALCWAEKIKKLNSDDIAVITVNFDVDQIQLFDLTDRATQMIFHKYRETMYEKITQDKVKDRVISPIGKNQKMLDCYIINCMCEYFQYNLVMRDAYINFKKGDFETSYPNSSIPNCTILCARNNNIIANMK